MVTHELRDATLARRFLLQGICEQHVGPLSPAAIKEGLSWALEAAAAGQALPPVGFLADLGQVAFGVDQALRRDAPGRTGLPAGLARMYEDHVLGKLCADRQFERASDALRRYQGRDRARGLAFVLNQFRERAGFPGVQLSPALIRGILEMPAAEALAAGLEARNSGAGLMPLLPELYAGLIAAVRRTGDILGSEDVFELEHGTAPADLGQRVALRQLLQAAERLESALPGCRVRPLAGRQEVPTRVLDEDTYPVGGYSALSTRGSIESLLQSQLAYMEKAERPDLFDLKYLRDELLYYARDENQFLRRRRAFIVALGADLARSRFKDPDLPWQRIVVLLGFLVALVRRLSDWLSTDALVFEFHFPTTADANPLAQERELVAMVLREQIANGTVQLLAYPTSTQLMDYCTRRARQSMCHCLLIAAGDLPAFRAEYTVQSGLQVDGPRPRLRVTGDPEEAEFDTPLENWGNALKRLLQAWV